jgi:ATP-dependent Lon protease
MFSKINEKYNSLIQDHNNLQQEENHNILTLDEEVLKKFLELFDKDVKVIHSNQEQIEKDLQYLYKETDKLTHTTKQSINLYDNFLENLKEAGDLFNWCGILEKEMSEIHSNIASKHKEKIAEHNLDEEK